MVSAAFAGSPGSGPPPDPAGDWKKCKNHDQCPDDYFFCDSGKCKPKFENGLYCEAPIECVSGFCVRQDSTSPCPLAGLCCDSLCEGACQTCVGSVLGTCTLLAVGTTSEVCKPYLCDGQNAGCSKSCEQNRDCAHGNVCDDKGWCLPPLTEGTPCSRTDQCDENLWCTDGFCCHDSDCGPYSCGPGGVCRTDCDVTDVCQPGYTCTAAGECVRQRTELAPEPASWRCSVNVPKQAPPAAFAMAALGLCGIGLKRRVTRRRRAQNK